MTHKSPPVYEVLALRYATRGGRRPNHFIGGDPHDDPMPMDYYVWVIRNRDRLFLVDTGFNDDMAKKRHRTLLRTPAQALNLVGVDPATVQDVILTHLHNDHVGTFDEYKSARFHLQQEEMAFTTGRYMRHEMFNRAYEPDHIGGMVRLVHQGRVEFHDGDADIAAGISVHHVGGHTAGLQVVRVHTARGWVVLASDASHYYEHFSSGRCFPLMFHIGQANDAYGRLHELAESPEHIIPGHDPEVMRRYPPASPALQDIAVSLHEPPNPPPA